MHSELGEFWKLCFKMCEQIFLFTCLFVDKQFYQIPVVVDVILESTELIIVTGKLKVSGLHMGLGIHLLKFMNLYCHSVCTQSQSSMYSILLYFFKSHFHYGSSITELVALVVISTSQSKFKYDFVFVNY